jgi:hypothetical protein
MTSDTPLTIPTLRPPHIPPSLRSPPTTTTTSSPPAPIPPNFTPKLTLTIFANQSPPNRTALPTNSPYYLDIIFSLQPVGPDPGLQTQLLTLTFPVGPLSQPTPPNPSTNAILTPKYDGPGPSMLGNNRFNATLSSTKDAQSGQTFLVITITPRSVSGLVKFSDNRDFSCILRQVAIDTKTIGSVPVRLEEQYVLASGQVAKVQKTYNIPKAP